MKKWKSLLLVCMLIFAIGMVTACGRSNNSGNQTENGTENTGTNTEAPVDETPDMNGAVDGDGAVEEQMQEDTIPDNGGTGSGMGATSGPEDTGLIEETGDALQRGVDDMTDGVKGMLDPNDDSQNNP